MSTEIVYPEYENDRDGFDDYVECVTRYVLSNIDYIGEIIDIYDFVEDFVSMDDDDWSVEVDEEYLQAKYGFDESDLDFTDLKVGIIKSCVRAMLANKACE